MQQSSIDSSSSANLQVGKVDPVPASGGIAQRKIPGLLIFRRGIVQVMTLNRRTGTGSDLADTQESTMNHREASHSGTLKTIEHPEVE